MLKAILPEDFLKKSYEKGPVNNKYIATREEVKKMLEL
jgi:hypothetical protein